MKETFFISFHYSTWLSSIFFISFHFSTYFSSIFSISFHYSTYFSSIFFISFHFSTYFSSIFFVSFHFSTYFSSLFCIVNIWRQLKDLEISNYKRKSKGRMPIRISVLFLLIVVLFVFLNIKGVKIKKIKFCRWKIFKCTLSKVEILGVLHNIYIYIHYNI